MLYEVAKKIGLKVTTETFAYSKYRPEAENHKFKDSGMTDSSSW